LKLYHFCVINVYVLICLKEFFLEDSVRWSLVVSKKTDISLRTYLAHHGKRKGDLSKFVEEAVRWRVLDKAVAETKAQNAHVSPEELETAIHDAVRAIRADHFNSAA
jgi:hypothetical protein